MRTLLKWTLILLAGLLGILLVAAAVLYVSTNARLTRVYNVQPVAIQIPEERPENLDGFQQLMISFCKDCHGPGMSGQIMENDPMVGVLAAPNLTSGRGGIGKRYTDEDWIRAIRHGVDEDGTPLLVMPSNLMNNLNEEDLAVIIAYMKNIFPVDNVVPETNLGLMGRLFILEDPSLLPAEVIDHEAPFRPTVAQGATVARGEYLASICTICHGPDQSGGPNASSGLNLTPSGNLANWSEEDFIRSIREGVTPEGVEFDPIEMPWKQIGMLSDEDLQAMWLYLQSLPPADV